MRSRELLAYLSLNCLSNGILSYSDAILLEFGPFLRNSTMCDGRTDGRKNGRTEERTDGQTDRRMDTPSYRDARTHRKVTYRNLRNKRAPPNKRPPSLFVFANDIEFKEKSEVFGEIDAKLQEKVGLFQL